MHLRRDLVLALALVLVGVGSAMLWTSVQPAVPAGSVALRDLDGNLAVLEDPPDASASDARPTGSRFQAPSQGLDVPLQSMSFTGGVINPPTLTDAFLLRAYGHPGEPSTGRVIVVMHAVHGGNAPGNALFDMGSEDSTPTVATGDRLVVAGFDYKVTSVVVETKNEAAADQTIWHDTADAAGELVVITCLQLPGTWGHARDNLVVHAERS